MKAATPWSLTMVLVLLATATAPSAAWAWGPTGHRVVGEIAQRHLTPTTARAIAGLLGHESLARASTYPDEVRSDPRWALADRWHYISVDDGETIASTERHPAGDVLRALACFETVLRDAGAAAIDRVVALRFLVHLLGDLHQPLHVGRRDDRGGNSIDVEFFWQPSNLHAVWDSGMIDHQRLSFSELAGFIDHARAAELADWQRPTSRVWAQESYDLRAAVYDFGTGPAATPPRLNYEYVFRHYSIVERRLAMAGVRLAAVLNSIFDSAAGTPASWSDPADRAEPLPCHDLGSRLATE